MLSPKRLYELQKAIQKAFAPIEKEFNIVISPNTQIFFTKTSTIIQLEMMKFDDRAKSYAEYGPDFNLSPFWFGKVIRFNDRPLKIMGLNDKQEENIVELVDVITQEKYFAKPKWIIEKMKKQV